MTLSNQQRSDRFVATITTYSDDDPYTNLGDCLADAMHWCHLNDHEFEDALDTARMHFDAELLEDALTGGNV
jgi:hypothetical protein